MMEIIENLRHMMANAYFSDAEKIALLNLKSHDDVIRIQVLPIYLDALYEQNKKIPYHYLLEYLKNNTDKNLDLSLKLINFTLINHQESSLLEIKLYKIKILEENGDLKNLLKEIKSFKSDLLKFNKPLVINWLNEIEKKYFGADFYLLITNLSLLFKVGDLKGAESLCLDILIKIFELKKYKDIEDKLKVLGEIIEAQEEKKSLEIYQSFCLIYCRGIREKKDYKRIIEMMIYAERIELKIMVLNLLDKLGLFDVASEYANFLKNENKFKVIYILKYFKNLKSYFVSVGTNTQRKTVENKEVNGDVSLETMQKFYQQDEADQFFEKYEASEEELKASKEIAYQELSFNELRAIIEGFIQSGFYLAAKSIGFKSLHLLQEEREKSEVLYLVGEALFCMKDYRASIDSLAQSIEFAKDESQILSCLYLTAEGYFKIGENKIAKMIYQKINLMDKDYRKVHDRLKVLDEY